MRLNQLTALVLVLVIIQLAPLASAQDGDGNPAPADSSESGLSVDIRMNTALQYPNDRDLVIEVAALAFAANKPLTDRLLIHARLHDSDDELILEREVMVEPGQVELISFGEIESVGRYEIRATATLGTAFSRDEIQTTRVTFAPQTYQAGFTDQRSFLVSPTCDGTQQGCNLTVHEYLDTGFGIQVGRSWVIGNETIEVEIPEGYLAVRYSVVDEWGWFNYRRALDSGITAHGSPYMWLYGDLSRIEPVSSYTGRINVGVGLTGGLLILIGVARMAGAGHASHRERIAKLPPGPRNYHSSWGERRDRRRWNDRRFNDPWDERRWW